MNERLESRPPIFSVAPEGCLRCGACSSLAPGLIAMGEDAAVIVRQPETIEETTAMYAALYNCPLNVIRKRSVKS